MQSNLAAGISGGALGKWGRVEKFSFAVVIR